MLLDHLFKVVTILFILHPVHSKAQNEISVSGMGFSYQWEQDSIEISIFAPTEGWLGVGFNDENNIVGSDLILLRWKNGKVDFKDLYVKGVGDPREDQKLGGNRSIRIVSGIEENDGTLIVFKIPIDSKDSFDFKHEVGRPFWLILAYSTHDDFDHHSRVRKHVRFQFGN